MRSSFPRKPAISSAPIRRCTALPPPQRNLSLLLPSSAARNLCLAACRFSSSARLPACLRQSSQSSPRAATADLTPSSFAGCCRGDKLIVEEASLLAAAAMGAEGLTAASLFTKLSELKFGAKVLRRVARSPAPTIRMPSLLRWLGGIANAEASARSYRCQATRS